uniref:Uncharacterized protein n=1 Tax=Malurus cyaneus samueli TaxID=2593467 RepID=A0A8C5TVI2_9PASS
MELDGIKGQILPPWSSIEVKAKPSLHGPPLGQRLDPLIRPLLAWPHVPPRSWLPLLLSSAGRGPPAAAPERSPSAAEATSILQLPHRTGAETDRRASSVRLSRGNREAPLAGDKARLRAPVVEEASEGMRRSWETRTMVPLGIAWKSRGSEPSRSGAKGERRAKVTLSLDVPTHHRIKNDPHSTSPRPEYLRAEEAGRAAQGRADGCAAHSARDHPSTKGATSE